MFFMLKPYSKSENIYKSIFEIKEKNRCYRFMY